jgi:hypothetical protein
MNKSRLLGSLLLISISLILSPVVNADLVTIEFTAEFSGGNPISSNPTVFPGGFEHFDPVVGSYTYDTSRVAKKLIYV